jgi:hypothetical protein
MIELNSRRYQGIAGRSNVEHRTSNIDGFVKSRITPFIWIPAFAGMTIKWLISVRYSSRHTREGGYPVIRTTFYESINFEWEKKETEELIKIFVTRIKTAVRPPRQARDFQQAHGPERSRRAEKKQK